MSRRQVAEFAAGVVLVGGTMLGLLGLVEHVLTAGTIPTWLPAAAAVVVLTAASSRVFARSGPVGHLHGQARARVTVHEAGHVVAAGAVGGRVTSAKIGPAAGWGVDGWVSWTLPRGDAVKQAEAVVTFLRAGEYAAGSRAGCGGDRDRAALWLASVPASERGAVQRRAESRARRIVASHQGEIRRVAAQLDEKGESVSTQHDIDQQPAGPASRPPWIVWLGLAVVLLAAAVLSFDTLRELASAVDIPEQLGWLLPISIDAGAAVSCAIWLGGRTHRAAARFAGRMTWALLGVTVGGNAGQLGMHANHIEPPWWVAVAVGSIPPAIVGACVHLVVLLVRRSDREPTDADRPPTALGEWPPAPPGWTPPADTVWVEDEWQQVLDALPVGPDGDDPTAPDREPTDEYDRGLDSAANDDTLIADMQEWAAVRGRPVSRDDAVRAYGIGGPRARKLRLACGWPRGADEDADRSADEPTAVGRPVG